MKNKDIFTFRDAEKQAGSGRLFDDAQAGRFGV